MELTPPELQEILRIFVDSDLRELEIEVGDVRMHVTKDAAPSTRASHLGVAPESTLSAAVHSPREPALGSAPQNGQPERSSDPLADGDPTELAGLTAVRAPVVGVFYRRRSPDQPPYVEPGDPVEPDTPVATLEVMKTFTEVPAGCRGRVADICVDNEQFVEHGQVLMYVDTGAAG